MPRVSESRKRKAAILLNNSKGKKSSSSDGEMPIISIFRKFLRKVIESSFKVAQNSFQHFPRRRFLMGHYYHSLSVDATIMVSKNCPIISEHVSIIFMTLSVTIATLCPAKNTLNFSFKPLYFKNGTVKFFLITEL